MSAAIAFVRPRAPLNRYIRNVPLNYVHLAAWLRERGHEAVILDGVFDEITPAYIDRVIRERGIGVVGIGCITCELPQALAEAARLKRAHPGLRIVFGGAHPSGDPEECLQSGAVDYVVRGEGEIPLAQLLDALREGREPENVQGLWKMRDGAVLPGGAAEAPDVAGLPRPAYDLLDLERYYRLDSPWHFPKSRRAVQFITQRGCPYQCSYCHEIHTKRFRGMPAETVLDQMEWLVREHGAREFMIVDDIFNFDLERAKEICRGVCGFFMIGFPGETLEEVQATLAFAVAAPLDSIFISIVAPFKGTGLRADMVAGSFGEMSGEGLPALDRLFPVVHNPALPAGLLMRLRKRAYWRFYLRPRALTGLAARMTSFRNARKLARAVTRRVWEPRVASVN